MFCVRLELNAGNYVPVSKDVDIRSEMKFKPKMTPRFCIDMLFPLEVISFRAHPCVSMHGMAEHTYVCRTQSLSAKAHSKLSSCNSHASNKHVPRIHLRSKHLVQRQRRSPSAVHRAVPSPLSDDGASPFRRCHWPPGGSGRPDAGSSQHRRSVCGEKAATGHDSGSRTGPQVRTWRA